MQPQKATTQPPARPSIDPAELALYRNAPGSPEAELRFVRCVLARYPKDVWALSTLATHAKTDHEFERQVRAAIRIGLLAMEARVFAGEEFSVATDPYSAVTLRAMLTYGSHLAIRGRHDDARNVLATMLEIDNDDTVGAVAYFEEKGIVLSYPNGVIFN
jgi:hypothetical protein